MLFRSKQGKTPKNWSKKKRAHKDTEARWTKKGGQRYYGYKNHIKINAKSKLIEVAETTAASVHDSQMLAELVAPSDEIIHGDCAYNTPNNQQLLAEKGIQNQFHQQAYRNRPLSEKQQQSNRIKSKNRARVEHVFGRIWHLNGGQLRSIGLSRARRHNSLSNLLYNLTRYRYLSRAAT